MYILSMSMFTSLSIQNHDCQKLFSYFLPWKLRQWQTEWEMAKVGRSLKSEVTKFHACRRCHLSWSLLLLFHRRASLKSKLTKIIHSRCCPLSPLLSHIKSSNQEKSCNIWCGLNEKGTTLTQIPEIRRRSFQKNMFMHHGHRFVTGLRSNEQIIQQPPKVEFQLGFVVCASNWPTFTGH